MKPTPRPRENQETVAETANPVPVDQDEPTLDVEQELDAVTGDAPGSPDTESSDDMGQCDNHPDRAAVMLVTTAQMKWLAKDQRFCDRCIPDAYRVHLR